MRYFRSLTKTTLGEDVEPPRGGVGRYVARAFVDRFSTLVIQQLFWGTRVYRTSPLKTNILCNESIVTVYVSLYSVLSVLARDRALTDGSTKRDGGDVEILRPLFLDVSSRKRGRSQRFLRLISRSPTRDGQNKRSLVRSRRTARDSETTIPSAVDAFGWVHVIQLRALID